MSLLDKAAKYSDATDTAPAELSAINRRLDAGDARMMRIETDLSVNTAATQQAANSIAELVDILNAWKGAFKVFEYVGKLAKPLGAVVALGAAVVGFWSAWKGSGIGPK